jgi:hypothetical protein
MNLVYMAKPTYGGWVTFTAHLSHKTQSPIFKVGKRTESRQRSFGYNCSYQNMKCDELCKKDNLLICALDKHYYPYLTQFPPNTKLVIHDPTEYKTGSEFDISRFEVITIRSKVQEYLLTKGIQSVLRNHPFFKYPHSTLDNLGYKYLSISRIDFDKHTDIILKANQRLPQDKKIYILGKENRLYVHHKLSDLSFHNYWLGKYPKTLPMSFNNKDILTSCEYIIDMSIIKGDGGGTQYTFLEAIYHDCILILHKDWINQSDLFQDKVNCLAVSNENELAELLMNEISEEDKQILRTNAKKIVDTHSSVIW